MPFVAMAPAVSGTIASSSEYNKVVSNVNQLNTTRTKYKQQNMSGSNLTVGTSAADLTGTSMSVTTPETNTQVKITGVFDVESTNTDILLGTLVVDGVSQTTEAHYSHVGRATIVQQWVVTLSTAGAHTIKLQAAKVGTTGTVTIYTGHSNICAEGQGIT